MNSIIDMVDEGISILNGREDITRFGELLHEAWKAKSDLSSLVSNRKVDEIYDWARSGGAVGGKLLGAGGGGFMLLFVPPEKQAKMKERLNKLIHVPFKFESSGSQIIFFETEEDYSKIDQIRSNQNVTAFRELEEPRITGQFS
jgi:D-glycero-alpha-D-manno-heptose-7-phosphate kinase